MNRPDVRSFSCTRLLFSLLFVVALLLPAIWGFSGTETAVGKPKEKMEWPGMPKEALFNPDYYKAWVQYAQGRLTAAGPLFKAKNWIDYRVFAMTETDGVHVGRSGWLFDKQAVRDYRKAGCQEAPVIERLILSLRAAAQIVEASGRRLVITIVPNKSTIYPEYMGAMPRDNGCGRSPYDILIAALAEEPLEAFVRLDKILVDAKAAQRLLYGETGTSWNADGARVGAHILMQRLTGGPRIEALVNSDDLTSALMLSRVPTTKEERRPTIDGSKNLSSAVIYGGQALNSLLPHLLPRFERIDVIASASLPSMHHDEDLSAYDTIILVVPEWQLSDLRINLDLIGRSLDATAIAAARQTISLDTVVTGNDMALNREVDHLVIKSMGREAYFTLPPIAGSATDGLRVLQLDLTAPHIDSLKWTIIDDHIHGDAHALFDSPNRLYLPLPQMPLLHMRIYPGENAGIFQLQGATLLTYGEVPEAVEVSNSPQPRSIKVGATQGEDLPAYEAPPPQEIEPDIRLMDFEFKQVFQRRGTAGDVFISGTYRGSPGAVEARVVAYDTDAVIMPWSVVDNSPAKGIFMGVLPGIPQGGWYRMAVRFRDHPDIMARGDAPWGVGMLIACIGQSNMKEWFHTGSDIAPNRLLSIHRDGKWSAPETTGNGAAALADRLIAPLNLPVGLLDYAVNGSGLRPEANWGTGYWADRGPESIYQRFIRGVTAAGGALEYVIWMQGEADAARKSIAGNLYHHTLKSFITQQVRQDITNGSHKAHLPFLVVGMVKRPVGADAAHQEIRNALVAVTHDTEDTYLAATTLDLKTQGRQHLAPKAYTALGRRIAQTILSLLDEADYYRGPVIERIEKVDAATIDLYLIHHGGNDFNPQDNITGFEVLKSDAPLAIEKIARQDDHRIRIQLNQPTQAELRLTYLYGAMPDTSGAVFDNSELQLPLEPFEAIVE